MRALVGGNLEFMKHIKQFILVLILFAHSYNSFCQEKVLAPGPYEFKKKDSIKSKILEVEKRILTAPKELKWRFSKIRMLLDNEEFSSAKQEIIHLLITSKSNKHKWYFNNIRINKSSSKKIIVDSLLSFRLDFFADYNNSRIISNIKIIMNKAYEVFPNIDNLEFLRMLSLSCPLQEKEDILLKAYKLDSRNIKVLYELAEYYFSVENNDKALKFFKYCKQNSTNNFLLEIFDERIDEIIKRKNQ